MGQRMVGSLMFVGAAIIVFEIAGRLASEQRAGWGWFVLAGLILSGVALNFWNGDVPKTLCPRCQKPYMPDDLE
jgi:hypothetical protein